MIAADRSRLIESFTCYWQIDFMYRHSTYQRFPIVEGQVIDNTPGEQVKGHLRVPDQVLKPPPQYRSPEYQGYRFYLPKAFAKQKGKNGVFANKDNPDIIIEINVSESLPVDNLSKMPEH